MIPKHSKKGIDLLDIVTFDGVVLCPLHCFNYILFNLDFRDVYRIFYRETFQGKMTIDRRATIRLKS